MSEVAISAAVKKVAGEEATASANFLKNKIAEKWNVYLGGKEMESYLEKVVSYFHFYTIMNPEKKVYIDDVYVPLKLRTPDNFEFTTDKLLFKSRNINVISGIAGHGKSTMLRHLMRNIILSDESDEVPIFFELKYFKEEDIENQICEWLNNNGLNVKLSFIRKLLRQGKLVLFFDAFDELPSELMDICVSEITKLHQKYPKSSMTVTTRPGLQITKSQFAVNYRLVELDKDQVFQIIEKVSNDKERAQNAIREIYKSKFISGVIKTPILAVLINLTYEYWNHLPETMSEFYESVFSTLLRIHDGTKSGKKVDRELNIDLHDYQILEVVYNISYKLSHKEKSEFSKVDFEKICSSVLEKKKFKNENIAPLFRCLNQACNIVISDGLDEYKFIHKSFQEFYTAKYVEELHHNKKEKFYSECLHNRIFLNKMKRTLDFLFEIDETYFFDYFVIPYLLENKVVLPFENEQDISLFRFFDFTHLVNIIISSKYIANRANIIETVLSDLYVYKKIIDDNVIDDLSEIIDEEVKKFDLTKLHEHFKSSHKFFEREDMYSVKNIVSRYDTEGDFIKNVLHSFSHQLIEVERVLEERLDFIFEQKITTNDEDMSDL